MVMLWFLLWSFPITYVGGYLHQIANRLEEKGLHPKFSLEFGAKELPDTISKAPLKDDMYLYSRYLRGLTGGLVVEIGSGDGFTSSYSFFFQHYANFTSLHVEGDESTYARLKMVRPHSVNVHAVVCDERKRVHWGKAQKRRMRGILELMPLHFLKTHYPTISTNPAGLQQEDAVMCKPLSEVFKAVDLRHAHLLVLDVNGAEVAALKGMNHNTFNADVISMPCTNAHKTTRGPSGRNAQNIFAVLEPVGYACEVPTLGRCVCVSNEYKDSPIFRNVTALYAKAGQG